MKGVAMPRRKSNALGKPQGVKKKKAPAIEQPVFKQVVVPMSIKNRIDPDTIAALKAVFG
jgi:hypothetical protein